MPVTIWTQSLILWKIMTFEKMQKYVFVHKSILLLLPGKYMEGITVTR